MPQSNLYMDNEIKTWLYDILQSIAEIDSYFEGKVKIFETYSRDIRTKRAVERNIEIIGEAINRILRKNEDFSIENAQKIIGARNRIAYGYDKISDDLIWSIVINHLPKLQAEIFSLMEK